jgi:hypothetical protein
LTVSTLQAGTTFLEQIDVRARPAPFCYRCGSRGGLPATSAVYAGELGDESREAAAQVVIRTAVPRRVDQQLDIGAHAWAQVIVRGAQNLRMRARERVFATIKGRGVIRSYAGSESDVLARLRWCRIKSSPSR